MADPTITVVDRNEASIKIVTKIPYQQLTQTQQGGNIGTTAFQEAGITLTVTPRIAQDRTIQMRVRPEFSTLIEYVNGQPLIDSRAAETDVRVADCHTLVIGGLRRRQMSDAIAGIPGLFKLKHVGRLFGAHESGITESELLVFLRPEIITPYDQLRSANRMLLVLPGSTSTESPWRTTDRWFLIAMTHRAFTITLAPT